MCSFSYNVVFLARGTRHCTARKFATPPCVSPFGHKENRRVYTLCPASKKQKLVPTGAFRPLTGSSSALRGRFCVFCIPIVLPHGTPPFRGSVRQDDRNATFSAARLSDLLHRSYLLSQQSPASSRPVAFHRHSYAYLALNHNTNTCPKSQAFFTNFFKKFWSFVLNFCTPQI